MKKKINRIFVTACLILCLIPFACMAFARTDVTTENKRLKELPSVYENNSINFEYFKGLGDYFNDRFAFRNAAVNADSLIQNDVFKTSNVSTVVKGENGWLYYSDTLNDYLGRNTLTDRGIYNTARNISLIQEYVKSTGADFAITIAPNKNSLYGDNMPYYYSQKASDKKNITALTPLLKSNNIKYTDLFALFESNDETLYLKRDSHWNNKGAMLAFDDIMSGLNRSHIDYSTVKALRTKTEYGDLNKMLYPISAEPEWNYYYQYKYNYSYKTDTKSVEDAWIETENKKGSGSLLMYRDSFGNTLLPFFAEEFKSAYFSKAAPYALEENMETCVPDCVIIEKVERNIDQFASDPPIITGPFHTLGKSIKTAKTNTTLKVKSSDLNASYITVSGTLDSSFVDTNTDVYINVVENGKATTYNAFNISDKNGDNGYLLYLPKDLITSAKTTEVEVIVSGKKAPVKVKTATVNTAKLK